MTTNYTHRQFVYRVKQHHIVLRFSVVCLLLFFHFFSYAQQPPEDKTLPSQTSRLYAQFSDPQQDFLDEEFDEMDEQLDAQFMQLDANLEAQYNALHQAIQTAFNSQAKKIEVVWPSSVKVPAGSVWVAYSDSLNERVIYDFEQGYYEIEIKKSTDMSKNLIRLREFANKINKDKASTLQDMDVFGKAIAREVAKVKDVAKNENIQPAAPTPQKPPQAAKIKPPEIAKEKPSLAKVSTEPKGKDQPVKSFAAKENYETVLSVTPKSVQADIDLLVANLSKTNQAAASQDSSANIQNQPAIKEFIDTQNNFDSSSLAQTLNFNETQDSWSIKVPFVNNYQQRLIEERMPTIMKMSDKYDVDVSLILAIIEAESSFNPMATSHIPAFGLMQLVPKTAGIDAYNHIYGYKKVLSPEYLYDVENNLELGTAYIDVLQSRYLRGITNDQNKLYSIVASYNTGVGNLAKTVTGKNRIRQAIGEINELAPNNYYDLLQQNLPASETKNYLTKVLSKREKYQHLDGT